MLQLSGTCTNHNNFTPPPSPQYPNPRTFKAIEIEGIRVALPESFDMSKLPQIGANVSVIVTARNGDKGLSFSILNAPNAISIVPAR